MSYDPHKDMNIRYNHLNLPDRIEFSDCRAIEYAYDASGLKLRKTIKNGNTILSTHDYIEGIEYKNKVLEAIYNSEGRLYFENGSSRYEYNLHDHLGNQRVLFSDANNDGTPEIIQENHYYPFGLEMQGNFVQNTGREHRYKFNGIERNTDFGIGLDMAKYRTYDPAIGRWLQIDPEVEQFYSLTPYNNNFNNPIRFDDPDGDCPNCIVGAIVK